MKVLDLKDFNNWLYAERNEQGLTQAQVERLCGVSHVMISNYENGADIRISTLIKLLGALGYDTKIMIRRRTK